MKLPLPTLLGLAFLLPGIAPAADRVTLEDGKTLEGRVVFEDTSRLVLRVGSKEREIPTSSVESVHSAERSLRPLLERWEKLSGGDVAGRLELAKAARLEGLEGEASVLAWSVLAIDPASAAAHELLGHEQRGAVWQVKDGARSLTMEKLLELRRDFSHGWRLSTTHYALRTNLPLAVTCQALLELELFYQTFFEWHQGELALYHVTEPMQGQVHADHRSYPGGDGRPGFFGSDTNTFFLDASAAFEPGAMCHEATHQLLFNTATHTRAALGSIPAWIDEGLADTMMYCRAGAVGHPRFAQEAQAKFYFTLHAQARKPYDLSRVLSFSTEDFISSSHVGLTYAQAYTLVQYCLQGAEAKYRARFFEYLRRCYAGSSSVTDFKSALGIQEAAFEAEWQAYAKAKG